jgi:hypothetical protein
MSLKVSIVNKKIFVFLPDGVGLRNFAFTKFKAIGKELGADITFWNNTTFDLNSEFGYKELKLAKTKTHWKTTLLKRARIRIELDLFSRKFNDITYQSYKFPQNYNNVKNALKSLWVDVLVAWYKTDQGLIKIQDKINRIERNSDGFKAAIAQLKKHKPDLVFCTNQRVTEAIAPILAAKKLGIATACFIFSWDNLPKATKIIATDYYFVWSNYMKKELFQYYPKLKEAQIIVSGTPQFEPHFDQSLFQSREAFCIENGLDPNKKYICFSGDDVTTSPFDEYYLEDLVDAVHELNADGENIGILFRRCPVDFSDRYNKAVNKFENIVFPVAPKWMKFGSVWNTIMPTPEDTKLLVNTALHCECVFNIGSSMVFDFVSHHKPCVYLNYDQDFIKPGQKQVNEIYSYIHFRSMPNRNAVIWVNSKQSIKDKLKAILRGQLSNVSHAKKWMEVINVKEASNASKYIWDGIANIVR